MASLAHKTRQHGERLHLRASTAVVMAFDDDAEQLLQRLNLALAKAKRHCRAAPETTMSSPLRWYEWDSRFIAAHHQPAVLLDLALSRGIDSHALLRGSGCSTNIASGRARVSPAQLLTLIGNAERLLGAADSSFLFGQRLLPGHYGEVSLALANAGNLEQALERLCQFRALLCPLLAPRLLLDERQIHLYWLDGGASGRHQRFLVEAHLTAIVALCKRGSGLRLPWRFQFAYAQPRHRAVLGASGRCAAVRPPADPAQPAARIPASALAGGVDHRGPVAVQASQQQIDALDGPCAFLDAFYQYRRRTSASR